MKTEFSIGLVVLIGLGIIVYFTIIGLDGAKRQGFNEGYKAACVDFYKGKLKMDLVENPDGTKEWKWIENKK